MVENQSSEASRAKDGGGPGDMYPWGILKEP